MTSIDWTSFWIIFISCAITIFVCRVFPLLSIKGKTLPHTVERVLEYIPAAVFAALVANDLFQPGMFNEGWWPAGIPLVASLFVVVCAFLTKSMVWCVVVGILSYLCLSMWAGIG